MRTGYCAFPFCVGSTQTAVTGGDPEGHPPTQASEHPDGCSIQRSLACGTNLRWRRHSANWDVTMSRRRRFPCGPTRTRTTGGTAVDCVAPAGRGVTSRCLGRRSRVAVIGQRSGGCIRPTHPVPIRQVCSTRRSSGIYHYPVLPFMDTNNIMAVNLFLWEIAAPYCLFFLMQSELLYFVWEIFKELSKILKVNNLRY